MKLKNKKTGEIVDFKTPLCMCDDKSSWQYDSLSEFEEDWEDAPEEPKEYWYINSSGEVNSISEDEEDEEDTKVCKEIGNYFETREEAEKAVEKLKAWKRLKEKNFHFLNYSALGCGEIEFSLDFEDMEDEGEIGELRRDLDICFGGEE